MATHEVAFIAGSMAENLFKTQFLPTNSHHHQCVHRVADDLTVSGTTVDGVVEALEWPEREIFAVQFHPERMRDDNPTMCGFFKNWIERVAAVASNKKSEIAKNN